MKLEKLKKLEKLEKLKPFALYLSIPNSKIQINV